MLQGTLGFASDCVRGYNSLRVKSVALTGACPGLGLLPGKTDSSLAVSCCSPSCEREVPIGLSTGNVEFRTRTYGSQLASWCYAYDAQAHLSKAGGWRCQELLLQGGQPPL